MAASMRTAPFNGLACARRLLFLRRPPGPQRAGYAAQRVRKDRAELQDTDTKLDEKEQTLFPRLNEPHHHVDTVPPTDAQLAYASLFFSKATSQFLFSCSDFRNFPADSASPEVAFLGRSNVGKSSLLNALMGRKAVSGAERHSNTAKVSSKPGRTRTMNCFAVHLGGDDAGGVKDALRNEAGDIVDERGRRTREAHARRWIAPGRNQLVVVDMPGYGHGSREEWGKEIMKYLTNRRQLRRAYVLIDAEHHVKSSDLDLMRLLALNGVPYQAILTKADKLLWPRAKLSHSILGEGCRRLHALQREIVRTLKEGNEGEVSGPRAQPGLLEVLAVSAEKSLTAKPTGKKIGIDSLRWSILREAGMDAIPTLIPKHGSAYQF